MATARRLAPGDGPRATPAVGPASGGRAQFNLSSGAATAVVFVSILLCFILLCTYCRCARQRAIAGARRRAMRDLLPGATALFLRPPAAALPPVVSYASASAGAKKGLLAEDCPVCLEPFGADDDVRVVPACGHLYHAPCIDRWLDVRNSCPVCRCAVASIYDYDRARDAAAVADGLGGADGGDGDDQEAILERVVAMIEAIRDEQREEAAARRALGGDGGSAGESLPTHPHPPAFQIRIKASEEANEPVLHAKIVHNPARRVLNLVDSVLDGTVTYSMAALLLPPGVLADLDQRRRAFLWSGAERKTKGGQCLVAWPEVCTLKSVGGLGVKDLALQNQCLLLKMLHRLYNPGESAWAAWALEGLDLVTLKGP
ncbi:hypothetical protein U9M48_007917 [Paspalum notatum var. saurae]|uniref:RING-type E3 ubiquitin transferase n=1 Tax=Paspalum notatum var. saurae TaxID=547442 RepID=A0AAQ3SNN3_PASNO